MTAPQHLPARCNDGILSLPVLETGTFLNGVKRHLGSAPEHREHGYIVTKIDRVIAPLARHDHAAINVEDALELSAVESDSGLAAFRAPAPVRRPCGLGRLRTA